MTATRLGPLLIAKQFGLIERRQVDSCDGRARQIGRLYAMDSAHTLLCCAHQRCHRTHLLLDAFAECVGGDVEVVASLEV